MDSSFREEDNRERQVSQENYRKGEFSEVENSSSIYQSARGIHHNLGRGDFLVSLSYAFTPYEVGKKTILRPMLPVVLMKDDIRFPSPD